MGKPPAGAGAPSHPPGSCGIQAGGSGTPLLRWVVRLLGLVEGGLGCWPGNVLLVYHRNGDVPPWELVTAQAAPAGGRQASRGG